MHEGKIIVFICLGNGSTFQAWIVATAAYSDRYVCIYVFLKDTCILFYIYSIKLVSVCVFLRQWHILVARLGIIWLNFYCLKEKFWNYLEGFEIGISFVLVLSLQAFDSCVIGNFWLVVCIKARARWFVMIFFSSRNLQILGCRPANAVYTLSSCTTGNAFTHKSFDQCETIVKNWKSSSLSDVREDKHVLKHLLFFLHVPRTGGRTYYHW